MKKPVHVVKKTKDASLEVANNEYAAGVTEATKKVKALSEHFDDDIRLSVFTEENDDEIKFYLSARISF